MLVVVDDEPFILKAASRALAPMLAAWPAAFTVALVRAPQAQRSQLALADIHASGLISPAAPLRLYEEANGHPATNVLHTITDTPDRFARTHYPTAQLSGRAVSPQRHGGGAAPLLRADAVAADRRVGLGSTRWQPKDSRKRPLTPRQPLGITAGQNNTNP